MKLWIGFLFPLEPFSVKSIGIMQFGMVQEWDFLEGFGKNSFQKCCFLRSNFLNFLLSMSERGAAWIAHHLGVVGVAGSNPVAPTMKTGNRKIPRFFLNIKTCFHDTLEWLK